MEQLFLKVLNLNIAVGWMVAAILLARLLLKWAPRWISCLLWGLVGARLLFPFSLESAWSLIPSRETVPPAILYSEEPAIESGIEAVDRVVNPLLSEALQPQPWNSVNPLQLLTAVAAQVWLAGIAVLLLYALLSTWRLHRRVRASLPLEGRVFLCDGVESPFILGLFRPRIYLPSSMDGEEREAVLAHERAHLIRRDHWWKPLGYLLLSVYWMNPLLWVAYVVLCRDIELACDEKVIRHMEAAEKKRYSEVLLACSIHRRGIAACPLAFGEVGVRQRIRAVLHYKKPALWILIVSLLLSLAVGIFFCTDPKPNAPLPAYTSGSDTEGVRLKLQEAELGSVPFVTVQWINGSKGEITFGDPYRVCYRDGEEWVDVDRYEERVFVMIAYDLKKGGSKKHTYSLAGYDLSRAGSYRLEADYTAEKEKHTVWLEFELEAPRLPRELVPMELVYEDGAYSYSNPAELAPLYRIENNLLYSRLREGGDWVKLCSLHRVLTNKQNIDARFYNRQIWYCSASPARLRRNNAVAQEGQAGDSFYLLLEQKDGSVYLAIGQRDRVRWLYRLEEYQPAVSLIGGAEGPTAIQTVSPLDKAVSAVLYSHFEQENGYLHVVSYDIFASSTATSTPLAAHSGYMDVVTVAAMVMHGTYRVEPDGPVLQEKEVSPAILRFAVDGKDTYTLQELLVTADAEDLRSKFPGEIDEKLLDPWYYQRLEKECERTAVEKHAQLQVK